MSLVVALVLIVFRPVHRFVQNLDFINRYREKEFKAALGDQTAEVIKLKPAKTATKTKRRR